MEKELEINHWNNVKAKLKQEYPQLTNADLLWRHGTSEDLIKTIAHRLGKTRKQLQEIIADL